MSVGTVLYIQCTNICITNACSGFRKELTDCHCPEHWHYNDCSNITWLLNFFLTLLWLSPSLKESYLPRVSLSKQMCVLMPPGIWTKKLPVLITGIWDIACFKMYGLAEVLEFCSEHCQDCTLGWWEDEIFCKAFHRFCCSCILYSFLKAVGSKINILLSFMPLLQCCNSF